MLGLFRRSTDGAIFLGSLANLASVAPVAAFAFSTVDAAVTAREGALVRLAKHIGQDGLIAGLSIGQVVAAIKSEVSALDLDAQFIRETPDVATTHQRGDPATFLSPPRSLLTTSVARATTAARKPFPTRPLARRWRRCDASTNTPKQKKITRTRRFARRNGKSAAYAG